MRAYEVGEVHGHLYFAMEYVRGRTARDLIARYGHIPEPEALDYMEQIARAIATIVSDGDLRAELSRRGLTQAAKFSIDRYRERVEALYASLR